MSPRHESLKRMKRERFEDDRTNRAAQRRQWAALAEQPTSTLLPPGCRESAQPDMDHDDEWFQTSDGQWHRAETVPEETRWRRWWQAREREAVT